MRSQSSDAGSGLCRRISCRPTPVPPPLASGLNFGRSVKEVCHDCRCGNRERSLRLRCRLPRENPQTKDDWRGNPLPKNECGGPTTVPSPCLSRP